MERVAAAQRRVKDAESSGEALQRARCDGITQASIQFMALPENVCLRIPFPSPPLKCWQLQSRSITLTPLLTLCQHCNLEQVIGSKGHEKGEITKCIGCTKQAVRSGCQGCSTCEGFEIWFRAADANDPNVMLFCSRCGCATDKHSMDQASCAMPHCASYLYAFWSHMQCIAGTVR